MYRISEKFVSLDGEGPTAGELAAFIRLFGCNLNCTWCDTRYSFDEKEEYELLSAEDLCTYVLQSKVANVTITGGEPLAAENIEYLLKLLSQHSNLNVHVETNGTFYIETVREQAVNISFVIDYKLPSSGMEGYMCMDNLIAVRHNDVYKFVIADENDLLTAYDIIKKYNLNEKCAVHFSPIMASINPSVIAAFIKEKSLTNVKLQLQLHKIIWPGEVKGI